MTTDPTPIFNEDSLRDAIVARWGEYGAHAEVFDAILARAASVSSEGSGEWMGYGEVNLSACAYYLGVGTCSFGCREEPSCMTDEPLEGWPVIERHPCAEQGLRALRLQRRTANWLGWLLFRPYPDHLKTYVSEHSYRAPSRWDVLRWMNTASEGSG